MTWDDYYEKINDWAVSTAVSKISSLEDMGAPDEIVEALIIIGYENKKGAARLLNRALQQGIKFSGENLVEIMDLCPDAGTPITWSRFYDAFLDWEPEYAIARTNALTDFGNADEVLEVTRELFWDDGKGADRFIARALKAGVKFRDEHLTELAELCNEDTVRRAARLSGLLLPEDLYEEEEEDELEDLSCEVCSAIDAADYALECLVQAQNALDGLNAQLRVLQKDKSVQLKYGRLSTAVDTWIDDGLFDALTHLQIDKAQKRIARAITQVENIRRELRGL